MNFKWKETRLLLYKSDNAYSQPTALDDMKFMKRRRCFSCINVHNVAQYPGLSAGLGWSIRTIISHAHVLHPSIMLLGVDGLQGWALSNIGWSKRHETFDNHSPKSKSWFPRWKDITQAHLPIIWQDIAIPVNETFGPSSFMTGTYHVCIALSQCPRKSSSSEG